MRHTHKYRERCVFMTIYTCPHAPMFWGVFGLFLFHLCAFTCQRKNSLVCVPTVGTLACFIDSFLNNKKVVRTSLF